MYAMQNNYSRNYTYIQRILEVGKFIVIECDFNIKPNGTLNLNMCFKALAHFRNKKPVQSNNIIKTLIKESHSIWINAVFNNSVCFV